MPPKQPAPRMRLGRQAPNGISASIYGLVERGLGKQPRVAKVIRGTVEFPMLGALARVAGGKVKIEGSPLLARRVLRLLEI